MTSTSNKIIAWTIIAVVILAMAVSVVYSGKIPYVFSSKNPQEQLAFYDVNGSDSKAIQFPYRAPKGKNIKIRCTLPEVTDAMVLQVVCNFNSLTAYADGKMIDRWTPARIANIETDIGNYRAFIELKPEYSNSELVLEIQPRDSLYLVAVKSVSLNSMAGHLTDHVKDNFLTLIIGIILILLGLVAFAVRVCYDFSGNEIISNRSSIFTYISLFSVITGVWMISYLHLLGIIGSRTVLSGAVNHVSFMLMPYLALGIVYSVVSGSKRFLNILYQLAGISVICQLVLFLFGVCDMSDTLIVSHITCVATIASLVYMFIKSLSTGTLQSKSKSVMCVASIVLLVAIAIVMYALDKEWMLWFCAAVCVFIAMLLVETIKGIFNLTKDKIVTEEFRRHAFTDALTGLGSRYSYEAAIIELKGAPVPENFTAIVIDVNRLKYINDTSGHAAGDEVIMGVADCIVAAFKDVGTYYRTGGDEYVVFIRADKSSTDQSLEYFNDQVKKWHGDMNEILEVSYGRASAKDYDDYTVDELIKIADNAMYENKRNYYKQIGYSR